MWASIMPNIILGSQSKRGHKGQKLSVPRSLHSQIRRETIYYILLVHQLKIRILERKKKRHMRKHGAFRGRTGLLNVVVRISFPEMVCKPRPGKSENKPHECDYLGKIIPSRGNSKYKALEGESAWQGAHITGVL